MKKYIVLLLVAILLVGCGENAENVITDISVNLSEINNDNNEIDIPVEETTETEDSTDAEEVTETESTTDVEEVTETDVDETTDPTDVTENETTEEVTTDATETEETTEEVVEETEPVDYTANIARPYDDVDYSPQIKNTDFKTNPAINVKGVFITANTAGSARIDEFVELLNETELNALVIDVKGDDGSMLFYSKTAEVYVPEANSRVYIDDMDAFMKKMKENNIYTIARIVTFKSPQYALKYPERAITYKSSGNLYYADGAYWASPFDQELWKYNVGVAKEAIEYGFNEIQFDYVRFPATGSKLDKNLDFRNPDNNTKTFAVQEFVKYAYSELNPLEAFIALDVFGWTATTVNDSGIGQHWEGMSNVADYMCPMVYPSHYGPNIFGLPVPDANPYRTIYEAMSDSIERNSNIETPAKLRPWLQGFTAKWVEGYIPYRTAEIQAQIQACNDLGIEDYIFWNSSNNYYKGWFE